MDHLGSPDTKEALNRALFTEVAPRYDFVTKALSLGRDASWKRRLVAALPDLNAPVCVDLACGTGDLTRLLATRYTRGRVAGIDLTPSMLELARRHTFMANVEYTEGSMDTLPFEDHSVDVVTGGYALRNAPDLNGAVMEIDRVLQSGGVAGFLDFSKPTSRMGQAVHHVLLKGWGGFWGLVLHGNVHVYGYIADSLRFFPDRNELLGLFRARRFELVNRESLYGGLLEALVFRKEKKPQS
jgi:demethylmenaquinone methyltransferase/2-methoxy-6-polyprenyl-1,4-benzoquinol methylase